MARRTPFKGSNPSGGCESLSASCCTSFGVISPCSPLPVSVLRLTPIFLANKRTAGVALARDAETVPTVKTSSSASLCCSKCPTTVPSSTRALVVASKATNGSPVLITSPGLPKSLAIFPACGQGTSTTAFAVSIDTRG